MKKIILVSIYFLALILSIQAQTLYGLTHNGGKDGTGALIKFTPTTNDLTIAKSFELYAAHPYYTNFIQANDGKLYGMTTNGGLGLHDGNQSVGYGIIFSFDASTSNYTMLKAFDGANGSNPRGSLVQASNGKLYGMTSSGGSGNGSYGYGVIFSYDPSTGTYTMLKAFDDTNGSYPFGSLVQTNNGKLYGMTSGGGSNGYGVIFSFDPSTSTYTKLKDFDGANGRQPYGSLMQAGNGKLYGMTSVGGSGDYGVIFSFDPSSSTYTKLKDFDNLNGSYPSGSLMKASNGKLYGMTGAGGNLDYGVIFSFDPSSSIYSKLKDFDYTNGYSPFGDLMQANDGKLYGMTAGGGSSGSEGGVIFSFDPLSSTYTKLVDFDYTKGNIPYGSLVQANNGKLYGMTNKGGSANFLSLSISEEGNGVIFSFDPLSSSYTKLRNLDANDGGTPTGTLLKAGDGKLYGMTNDGGSNAGGVIFSFDPSTSVYSKLFDFDGINGTHPYGSLIQSSNGMLYGMTTYGGIDSWGVLFSFDPPTSTFTKLKDFYGTNVINPFGSLIQASDGKLYGVSGDGANTIIFSFDPSSFAYYESTINHDPYSGSRQPYGNLMQAIDGKLYGNYLGDGGNVGNLFSFDISTSFYTRLKNFAFGSTDGYYPTGSLMQAGDGKLYGMTNNGGSIGTPPYYYGVIFSFDPSNSTYTKLKDFDGTNGANPIGSFMQASDGKLYGMTNNGGSNDVGIIFSFDPSSSSYTKLKEFVDDDRDIFDYYYYVDPAFIEVPNIALPVTFLNFDGELINNQVLLKWSTTNEINNKGFDVERSEDGNNFYKIGFVKGKGNNSSVSEYTFTDRNFNSAVNFYRLKQIDIDGNFEYSRIIKINASKAKNYKTAIAPNPFSNETTISFSLAQTAKVSLKILDLNGRLVATLANEEMQAGVHEKRWNANDANSKSVSSGIYLLRIEAGDFKETKKIFVIK